MAKRAPLVFDTKASPSANVPKKEIHANAQTNKQSTAKGRDGRQFIAAHALPEAAKQFRLLAVQQDKTSQELLIEAINDLFAKYGLSRIADE